MCPLYSTLTYVSIHIMYFSPVLDLYDDQKLCFSVLYRTVFVTQCYMGRPYDCTYG